MAFDMTRTEYLLKQPVRDNEVITELITLNSRLIGSVLKRFGLIHDDEAVSYGYEALYKAIKTYDHSTKFSTHATVYIYNRLGSYVRHLNTKIRTNTVLCDFSDMINIASNDSVENRYEAQCRLEEINKAVDITMKLHKSVKQKRILEIWIGSNFSATSTTIAMITGVSQSYVSQTINKFRTLLKDKLREVL